MRAGYFARVCCGGQSQLVPVLYQFINLCNKTRMGHRTRPLLVFSLRELREEIEQNMRNGEMW